jgi:DNA polymerase-4
MAKLPIGVLAKRFGNLGRRIWYMCQGADPDPLHKEVPFPKSMGHGKVIPPNTRDKNILLTYLQHMSEKLAYRLRQNKMEAQTYFIGIKTYELGWLGNKYSLAIPSNDGQLIFWLCRKMLNEFWFGQGSFQIQITALDPRPLYQQLDLFDLHDDKRDRLNQTLDEINNIFGAYTVTPAPLINRSQMPDVIAPAWKPDGHRQTIQKTKE